MWAIMLMGFHRDMVNTSGLMAVFFTVTSKTESGMAMEYGKVPLQINPNPEKKTLQSNKNSKRKRTVGNIDWIKNKVSESILG